MCVHHFPIQEQLLRARFPFYLPWDREEEEEKDAWFSSEDSNSSSHDCLRVTRRANRANEVLFLGVKLSVCALSMLVWCVWFLVITFSLPLHLFSPLVLGFEYHEFKVKCVLYTVYQSPMDPANIFIRSLILFRVFTFS